MKNDVDSGKIICERKFIIQNNDNIESLKFKSYLKILEIFYEILIQLNNGHALKFSKLKWSRKPYKISDLDKVNFYHYGENKKKIKNIHRSFDYYPYSPYCIKGEKKIKVKIKKVKNLI